MNERGMTRGARRAVVALFVLSLILAAANLLFTSHEISAAAAARMRLARSSVVQLCEAGNETRTEQVILWTHLVAISVPPPHETPAARAQRQAAVTGLLAYVRKVFASRNCTAQEEP